MGRLVGKVLLCVLPWDRCGGMESLRAHPLKLRLQCKLSGDLVFGWLLVVMLRRGHVKAQE